MYKTFGTHNYYVYILTNKNKTVLYIGVTNDLKERLFAHRILMFYQGHLRQNINVIVLATGSTI